VDRDSARVAGRFLIRNATVEAATVTAGGIHARVAAADTALSAARITVGAEMVLTGHCEILGRTDLSMGDISSLSVGQGSRLRNAGRTVLDLTNAEIRSLLRFDRDAVTESTVRLAGTVIHGTLELHGEMSGPERSSLVSGNAMTVEGDVYLDDLRTEGGRLNFRGATLGSLSADGATLHNPGGYTLGLSQAVIKGSVRLADRFTSTGQVVLNRSTIEGRLQLTGGSFTCPAPAPWNEAQNAIEAISATVRGGIDLGWKSISPSVNFTDTTTTLLADNPAAWPERYTIAGLTYDRFEKPQGAPHQRIWDQAARCAWLNHQTAFDSGPYEQAARVFRQHGYTGEAEQILITQQRHARQAARPSASVTRRAWDATYATIGYGYRPSRVLWLLAVLLVLVAGSLEIPAAQATLRANNGNGAVYLVNRPPAAGGRAVAPGRGTRPAPLAASSCGDGEVRCFSPVLYAVDTVLPLISLDQRATWYPDPHAPHGNLMMWWLNLATLLGWLLSSIFALSLAKLSRNP
jgi:hypothetical protein